MDGCNIRTTPVPAPVASPSPSPPRTMEVQGFVSKNDRLEKADRAVTRRTQRLVAGSMVR